MQIGDYVTRKKYNNDLIFIIKSISNDKAILQGLDYRLIADSNIDDLVLIDKYDYNINSFNPISIDKTFNYLPGSILHIDSDYNYLNKCLKYYSFQKLICHGYVLNELYYKENIIHLIRKYNPEIVVITGHDAYSHGQYKNSFLFIETVIEIRKKYKDIFIISGACQSDYYNLLKFGSNISSSPKRINVHCLDPAIIASYIAYSDKNNEIDIKSIIDKTISGNGGFGGFVSMGTMKKIYPRKENS